MRHLSTPFRFGAFDVRGNVKTLPSVKNWGIWVLGNDVVLRKMLFEVFGLDLTPRSRGSKRGQSRLLSCISNEQSCVRKRR